MSDKRFEKIDKKLMAAMKPLREQEVSEGMLKGFAASVERKILGRKEEAKKPGSLFSPAWAPALAVMVLASLAVFHSPVVLAPTANTPSSSYKASMEGNKEMNVEEEISTLKELGVWNDEDDASLGSGEDP